MRPLTDEEADWLNQFYKETVNAISSDAELYDPDKDFRARDGGWIYKENNDRNNCLYNTVKKTGRLSKYNYKDFDDAFADKVIKNNLDLEHALLLHSQLMADDEEESED